MSIAAPPGPEYLIKKSGRPSSVENSSFFPPSADLCRVGEISAFPSCPGNTRKVRSLFLSDLHLGFRHSRVNVLLALLRQYEPENLYLVGDFIDSWCLGNGWYWAPECNQIVSRLIELSQSGTQVRIAVGNHDNFIRDPAMLQVLEGFGMVEVAEEFHHRTADGRRFLVIHGHQFDRYENASAITTRLLSLFYEILLRTNAYWSQITSAALHGNSSLTAGIKRRLSILNRHVTHFRDAIIHHTRHEGCDGVICGHIHAPQHLELDGITYCNTGDWIENCTALLEDSSGQLSLLSF